MTFRSLSVRILLVVAALTTVATSAPDDIVLSATTDGTLGQGPTRITVSGNRAAVNHAQYVTVEFRADGVNSPSYTLTMPEDLAKPFALTELDRSAIRLYYDLDLACMRDQDCEFAVIVTVPSGAVHAHVTGSFGTSGDGGLLFPDDRSFPDDARVAIRFGP